MTNSNPNLNVTGKTSGSKGMGILSGKYYRTRSLSQNLQQIFQGFHYHQQLTQEMQKHKNGSESPTGSSNPIQVPGIQKNGSGVPPYGKGFITSMNGTGSPQKDAIQIAIENNPLLASLAISNHPSKINPAHIHNPNAPLFKSQSFHIPKMKGYNLANNRNLDLYQTRSISFDYSLNKPKLKLNMPYARTSNLMSLENTINENYDLIKENSPSLKEHLDFYAKRQNDHFNFDYSVPEYERRNPYHQEYLPKQLSDYPSTPPPLRRDFREAHQYQSLEDIVRTNRTKKKRNGGNSKGSKMNLFKDRYAYLETPIIGGSCDNLFSMSGKMMKENPYHDNYSTFHGVTKTQKGRIPFGNLYKKRAVYFHDDPDVDLGEESDESSLYSDSNNSDSSDSSARSMGHSCRYRAARTLSSVSELHRKPKKRSIKRRNSCKVVSHNAPSKYSPRGSPVQSRSSTPQSPITMPHPLTASFPPDNRNPSRTFVTTSTSPKNNLYKLTSVQTPPPLYHAYNNLSNNSTINNSHGPIFNVPTTPTTTPWNFLTTWQTKTLVRKLFLEIKKRHSYKKNNFHIIIV